MSSLYVSGIESSRVTMQESSSKLKDGHFNAASPHQTQQPTKPNIINYDHHAEVHHDANEFAINVSSDEKIVYYFVCF